MRRFVLGLSLFSLALSRPSASLNAVSYAQRDEKGVKLVSYSRESSGRSILPRTYFEKSTPTTSSAADVQALEDAFYALASMQKKYFNLEYGNWSTAIDWTAAVVGTVMTGMLSTLSTSLIKYDVGGAADFKAIEALVSTYYSQAIMSYFGQEAESLKNQAHDDMLWVVLQWLEGIQLISKHSALYYPGRSLSNATTTNGLAEALKTLPWHGSSWAPSFAHRSRIFWNLASKGWSTDLCGGGMTWNPRLEPYKNSITNELYIAASISMYRNFPGDNFTASWLSEAPFPGRDPAYLAAAQEGYRWLQGINMTNSQGLYTDGYHVNSSIPGNVKCDLRDEMVYTYNQGVILSGLRGLWAASGESSYLQDGHALIQAAINATGWDLKNQIPADDAGSPAPGQLPPWRGLGRAGIMEEKCDASGECSQDAQIFKGVYFHHLLAFCSKSENGEEAYDEACKAYAPWVKYNAEAALKTRNAEGLFGTWWGAPLYGNTTADDGSNPQQNATDYRNKGTPNDAVWGTNARWMPGDIQVHSNHLRAGDPNDRGRGRTVETQIGGLAVVRAYWELSRLLVAS